MNGTKLKYQSIDEIVRKYLLDKEKEGAAKRDNDWWWASEMGTCMRHQFLRRLGIKPKEKEVRIAFLGQEGRKSHDWITHAIERVGALVSREEKIEDPVLKYKGRFDAIVNLGNGNGNKYLVLVDIKTQRPEAFFKRSKLSEAKRVKPFQKMQLASYFYFAKRRYPQLKEARLYILDRGGGCREEFILPNLDKMAKKVLKELETLNDYWTRQELPPCKGDWMCDDLCKYYKEDLLKVEQGLMLLQQFKDKHGH